MKSIESRLNTLRQALHEADGVGISVWFSEDGWHFTNMAGESRVLDELDEIREAGDHLVLFVLGEGPGAEPEPPEPPPELCVGLEAQSAPQAEPDEYEEIRMTALGPAKFWKRRPTKKFTWR